MMNYKDIERLKATLINMVKKGCGVQIPSCNLNGRIIGVGFKPFWTGANDSKIEKLELNVLDEYGRAVPFRFFNVVDFNVAYADSRKLEDSKNVSLDISVLSARNNRYGEPFEKVRVDINVR